MVLLVMVSLPSLLMPPPLPATVDGAALALTVLLVRVRSPRLKMPPPWALDLPCRMVTPEMEALAPEPMPNTRVLATFGWVAA